LRGTVTDCPAWRRQHSFAGSSAAAGVNRDGHTACDVCETIGGAVLLRAGAFGQGCRRGLPSWFWMRAVMARCMPGADGGVAVEYVAPARFERAAAGQQ